MKRQTKMQEIERNGKNGNKRQATARTCKKWQEMAKNRQTMQENTRKWHKKRQEPT